MVKRRIPLLLACAFSLSSAQLDVWSAMPEIRSVEPCASLKLTGERRGDVYRPRLPNTGKTPVHVKEVALFRISHDLPDSTAPKCPYCKGTGVCATCGGAGSSGG